MNIQKDGVDRVGLERLQRFFPGRRFNGLIAIFRALLRQRPANKLFIVNNPDSVSAPIVLLCRFVDSSAQFARYLRRRVIAANATLKREPFPGVLATSIFPPWDCTMPFARDKPSPVPSLRVVKNGLKIFGEASPGIPLPGISDFNDCSIALLAERDLHFAFTGDGLNSIEDEVQTRPVGQARDREVTSGKRGVWVEENLDGFSVDLLPCHEDRLVRSGIDIRRMKMRRPGPCVGQEIIQNSLDMANFLLDIRHHCSARNWTPGAHVPITSTTPAIPARGLRISWAKPGGEFTESSEMLGTRHFPLMELLDFFAVLI